MTAKPSRSVPLVLRPLLPIRQVTVPTTRHLQLPRPLPWVTSTCRQLLPRYPPVARCQQYRWGRHRGQHRRRHCHHSVDRSVRKQQPRRVRQRQANRPTYALDTGLEIPHMACRTSLFSAKVLRYPLIQTSAPSSAVIRQHASQVQLTKPFGGNQNLTTRLRKFALGAIDSGIQNTFYSRMADGSRCYSIHVNGET